MADRQDVALTFITHDSDKNCPAYRTLFLRSCFGGVLGPVVRHLSDPHRHDIGAPSPRCATRPSIGAQLGRARSTESRGPPGCAGDPPIRGATNARGAGRRSHSHSVNWPSTVHLPSSSGILARSSGSRSGNVSSTRSGLAARSSSGETMGMSVPGIRRPCLATDASATAASRSALSPARLKSATARDAAQPGRYAPPRPLLQASFATSRRVDRRSAGDGRCNPDSSHPALPLRRGCA